MLSIFDDAQFFIGENSSDHFDPDEENPCSVVVAIVEQDGKTAKLYYWKDGLEEEKAVSFESSFLCHLNHSKRLFLQ